MYVMFDIAILFLQFIYCLLSDNSENMNFELDKAGEMQGNVYQNERRLLEYANESTDNNVFFFWVLST